MRFREVQQNANFPIMRFVSDTNLWELGLVSVRNDGTYVRAVHVPTGTRVIDYFVGSELSHQSILTMMVKLALQTFDEGTSPKRVLSFLPQFKQWPYFTDSKAWGQLQALAGFNPKKKPKAMAGGKG